MSVQTTNSKPAGATGNGTARLTKTLIGVGVAIVVLVGGFFGYKEFVQKPDQEKAGSALFRVEHWFEADSLQYVLDGDGQYEGALHIVKKYGSTDAGNLARYYAGMAYLNLGQFDEAIKMLDGFNGHGTFFAYTVYGSLGDAYMEKQDISKGISYYKKAAEYKDDFYAPLYLYRAAKAYELNNQADEAVALYKQISADYPFSPQAREVEKALGLLGNTDL